MIEHRIAMYHVLLPLSWRLYHSTWLTFAVVQRCSPVTIFTCATAGSSISRLTITLAVILCKKISLSYDVEKHTGKKKASKLHWKCTLDYYLLVYSPDCKWPESSPLHNNRTSDNPYRCPGSRIHRRTCHTEYQWRLINTCTGRSHNCMCHQNQGPCH